MASRGISIEKGKQEIEKMFDWLESRLSSIRSGRVMPSMLEDIEVDVYGTMTPINQIGKVGVVDASTLVVRLWDTGAVEPLQKALREDDRGFSIRVDGNNVYVSPPSLTDETRQEYIREVKEIGEDAYQRLRDFRNDMMDYLKEMLNEKEIGEEQEHRMKDDVEKLIKQVKIKLDEKVDKKVEALGS
jgi:ribosome recycling factor